jgi:hypothetical protein
MEEAPLLEELDPLAVPVGSEHHYCLMIHAKQTC